MGGLWVCPVCGERNRAERKTCYVCEKKGRVVEDLKSWRERTENGKHIVLTTTPSIDGYRIKKIYGIVTAECAFGINMFRDLYTSVSDVFGGRSGVTQDALRGAREACLSELKREADVYEANAVIGVKLDYSQFSGKGKSMLFLVASGTAVLLEEGEL